MNATNLTLGKPYNNTLIEITEPGDGPEHARLAGAATPQYAGLFAAAPELLASLGRIVAWLETCTVNGKASPVLCEDIRKARAAIAKATA